MVGNRKSLFERLGKPADKYHILEEKLLYKGQDVKTCRESVAPKRLELTQTLKIFFELATDLHRQIQTFSPPAWRGKSGYRVICRFGRWPESVFVCVCRASVASGWQIFIFRGDESHRHERLADFHRQLYSERLQLHIFVIREK